MTELEICTILLARGGSKGLPGKNIKLLDGHPLLAYTVVPALQSKHITRVIVSTDDEEIASCAQKYGAEVPFIRPRDLAQDLTRSEESLKHALDWLKEEENYQPDWLVYLQVTDLFKDVEQIDRCIQEVLLDSNLDSAFLAYPDRKNYWKNEETGPLCLTPGKHISRQKKTPVYREDTGLGCVTRPELIQKEIRRLGENVKIIPNDVFMIDVHTEFDLWLAEKTLTERPEYAKYRLKNFL